MTPDHFESLYPESTRASEIEKMVSFIKEGNSCQLIGLPGIGKSSLLGLLPFNTKIRQKHFGDNQGWVHFVLVNFSEVRSRPILDVTKFLFLALLDSLHDRRKEEEYAYINSLFKESLSYEDEMVLFQGLKSAIDYLAVEKQYTIVFLFDRFDEYIPMLKSEFFINLRVLRNRAKYRFSVVFSLTHPLDDSLDPSIWGEFHEFVAGNMVYMQLLDEPSMEFRLRYLEKSVDRVELEKRDIERIVALTGGHGKLTKLCAEITLADDTHDDSPEFFTTEHFLTHRRIIGACTEIWRSLSPSEQDALLNVLKGEHEEDTAYLTHVGLIAENTISIPLFAAFLSSRGEVGRNEVITFDTETNTIKRGDVVVSDSLTAAEFSLLAFLLHNIDRVVERNEVIDAVWKDEKSTAGVTDQALDQLISRLRRKIEPDPINPVHLETIKGRGFKFTP